MLRLICLSSGKLRFQHVFLTVYVREFNVNRKLNRSMPIYIVLWLTVTRDLVYMLEEVCVCSFPCERYLNSCRLF